MCNYLMTTVHGQIQRGMGEADGPDLPPPPKATKREFNVGPSSARQRTPFQWRFAGGPIMARLWWYLDPPSHHQLNNVVKVGPL